MAGRDEQDAWVARVLGVQVSDSRTEAGEAEFRERFAIAIGDAKRLADKEATGRIAALGKDAMAALKEGRVGAALSLVDAMETAVAEAMRAANRAGAVEESGSRVNYAKLLLGWRKAQAEAKQQLERFASVLLADEGVRADPRYDEVVEAAADLADVLPEFSAELEDVLDRLDGVTDPTEREDEIERARDLIEECRGVLEDAEQLAALSEFAADEFGQADTMDRLRDALVDLADGLVERG